MKKVKSIVAHALKLGTLISTVGFVGATLIQIFARFFLESAPSWTEEASRFFFVYAMSFAAGLAMKGNYYVHLDFIYNKLKEDQKKYLDTSISLLILVLFLLLGIYSIQMVLLGIPEKSPSLHLTMSLAFLSMLVMAIAVGSFAFFNLWEKLKKI